MTRCGGNASFSSTARTTTNLQRLLRASSYRFRNAHRRLSPLPPNVVVKSLWPLLLVSCLLAAPPVHGQEANTECEAGSLNLEASASSNATNQTNPPSTSVTDATPAVSVSPSTDAEAYVQDVIQDDGVHVVHFWAPWCANSMHELTDGWSTLVEENPDATFTFVTVWNDGNRAADQLSEHGLPDRVTEIPQPDLGPSDNESNRRKTFLTHPVTWIPSTWIFHNNGELAFAMNYGEMEMETIQSLLEATRTDW